MKTITGWEVHQAMAVWHSAMQATAEPDLEPTAEPDAPEDMSPDDAKAAIMALLERGASVVLHANALAAAAKSEIEALAERKKRFEARADRIRGLCFSIMDIMGERTAEFAKATLSVKKAPVGMVVADDAAIPERFARYERKIDKAALLAALKDGEAIDGAELTNGMPTLQIRGR
jgi:Siphovirus Gp157